ncbi:MAG: hypothetical protein JXA30_23310 [Deltaproteobacteria bacterium]|nr:hypothetical protein [Deltaproteobacteria bacterium]
MGKRVKKSTFILLLTAFFSLPVSPAAAEKPKKVRVVVEKLMGSKADVVRQYVLFALNKRREVELVSSKEVVAALTRLDVTLESENGYLALSRELKVNAFIDGEVTRKADGWRASIWVRQGNGKFIAQNEWADKKLRRLSSIKNTLWNRLGEAIVSARVGEPEPEPLEQEAGRTTDRQAFVTAEPEPSREVSEPGMPGDKLQSPAATGEQRQQPTALHARIALGANWRNNSYEPDDAEQPFRYYNDFLQATPWLAIQAKWFPAAHFSDEWFAHIGLTADFAFGLGASSEYEEPAADERIEPDTTSFAFSAGLLGRIPLNPVELGLTLAYGQRVFKTSEFEGLPDVAHGFLRMGANADISLVGGLGVDLAIAYLLRLDSGQLASDQYFPELSGGGVEALIGVYYKIVDWLSIRADWSVQYFFFKTGANQAFEDLTGADDGYYTAVVGVAYELGGDSR